MPAVLQTYDESPVYARVTGYVAKWYTDIGTRVHAGQLLAVIDAPQVDQQLAQARAARESGSRESEPRERHDETLPGPDW